MNGIKYRACGMNFMVAGFGAERQEFDTPRLYAAVRRYGSIFIEIGSFLLPTMSCKHRCISMNFNDHDGVFTAMILFKTIKGKWRTIRCDISMMMASDEPPQQYSEILARAADKYTTFKSHCMARLS